jgi:hypothetical protein
MASTKSLKALCLFERAFFTPVFNDPAIEVNRLSSWWRQLDAGRVFHDPSDLLKVLPRSSSGCSGRLQFVQQFLKFLSALGSILFAATYNESRY